jgi:hypothetical protein
MKLRYQKEDPYQNQIFIVSNKFNDELPAFEKLKNLESKLLEMDLGTFLPVYSNSELGYCTIRFKAYRGIKLVERNLYTVKFVVKKSERDDKHYINCFVQDMKLLKKAPVRDDGEILDFGI